MRLARRTAPAALALLAAPLAAQAQPVGRVYNHGGSVAVEEIGRWAERLGVTLNLYGVSRPEDIPKAFAAIRAARPDALMTTADRNWMTPPTWLDTQGGPRPRLACWTCGREVSLMRFRAGDLRPHGWQPSLSRGNRR